LSPKFCKCVADKNGIAIFSFIRTYFSVKKAKKEPKGPTHLYGQPTWDEVKTKAN